MKQSQTWSLKKHLLVCICAASVSYIIDFILNSHFGRAIFLSLFKGHHLVMDAQAACVGIISGVDGQASVHIAGGPLEIMSLANIVFFLCLMLLYKPLKHFMRCTNGREKL